MLKTVEKYRTGIQLPGQNDNLSDSYMSSYECQCLGKTSQRHCDSFIFKKCRIAKILGSKEDNTVWGNTSFKKHRLKVVKNSTA